MNIIIVSLCAYLAVVFGIAWLNGRKQSLDSYYLNEKSTGLFLLTISIVATAVGGGAIVGTISSFYKTGTLMYGMLLLATNALGFLSVALVARKIKAFGVRHNLRSIVDFFGVRFGAKNKKLMLVLQMVFLLPLNALQMLAASALLAVLLGIPLLPALALVSLSTLIYSSVGGMKTNVWTDFFQFFVIISIFIAMAAIAWTTIPSFAGLVQSAPVNAFNPFAANGTAWFLVMASAGGFAQLAAPYVWQQILSARDEKTAVRSVLFAVPIVAAILGLVAFLGLYAVVNMPMSGYYDTAFFSLIETLLPKALAGIGFAALFAAVMSTSDSILLAGSTIIFGELVKKNKKRNRIFYARLTSIGFGAASIAIAALFPSVVSLGLYTIAVLFISSPAVLAAFYSKKISNDAVFWSRLVPLAVLFIAYYHIGAQAIMITAPLGLIMLFLYDPVAKLVRR
ncbi:MAG: sodium:solute symporter family protein [Rickettsiales bacterium]|jgi:SSS family solute:Na+ symporter|nr:sodium:solute symporter family protein [Rickettsiales bacterium]